MDYQCCCGIDLRDYLKNSDVSRNLDKQSWKLWWVQRNGYNPAKDFVNHFEDWLKVFESGVWSSA